MDRRRSLWILGLAGALLLLFVGWRAWEEHVDLEASREIVRERRRREERREEQQWARVRRESVRLVPDAITGVALGMTKAELGEVRSAARPDEHGTPEPGIDLLSENLSNGARVVYAFQHETDRLERIQILSQLPSMEAIAPHLAAMNADYDAPTGAWDCPNTGGVPTRRFTWRRAHTTLSDVFLVYGERVAVTLYIAPTEVIQRSLQISSCRPIRDRAELEHFPVASREQMGAVQP